MEYIYLFFAFSIFLSCFFSSYYPLLLFNSIFLAYIIQEMNPVFSIVIILSVGLLPLGFKLFLKKKFFKNLNFNILQKNLKKKTGEINELKNEKEKKEIENKKNESNYDEIVKKISDKIEKEKKIAFKELAQVWLYQSLKTKNNKTTEPSENNNQITESYNKVQNKAILSSEDNNKQIPDSIKEEKQDLLKSDENMNEKDIQKKGFKDEFVNKIYSEFVVDKFYFEDLKILAESLLFSLDMVAGDPSVSNDDENDKKNYESYYDILKEITLAEHTYNTVYFAFELLQKTYKDTWKLSWDILCITAIAHDIGKGSEFKNNVIFYGSHKDISQEILKNTYNNLKEKISISEEKINRLCGIVSYHHGVPPETFSDDKTLKFLKEADSLARKKELEQKLGKIKSWNDINMIELGKEIYLELKKIVSRKDIDRKIYFIIDERKGLIFLHKDFIFLNILKKYIKEKNIFWREIHSKNEIEFVNSLKDFFKYKIEPLQWLPSVDFLGQNKGFFYFVTIEKNGRVLGVKPYVVFILSIFCKSIGVSQEEIISIFKSSPLTVYNIIYQR